MKRSRAVELVLLASSAAVAEGCRRQCVDERGIIVNNAWCDAADAQTGGHYYHFTGGYGFGSGSHSAVSSGTQRGVFGGAGASAHGGGGE